MADKPLKVKVGNTVELKGAAFVRLPDGSVVSTYGVYTLAHPGEHVIDGKTYLAED